MEPFYFTFTDTRYFLRDGIVTSTERQ